MMARGAYLNSWIAFLAGLCCLLGLGRVNAAVVINEVVSKAADGSDDWVELFNNGASEADISGWSLSDSGNTYGFPTGTKIAAGAYLVIEKSTFGFGLGSTEQIVVALPDGTTVDMTEYTSDKVSGLPDGWSGVSWARCGDSFRVLNIITKGQANDCPDLSGKVRVHSTVLMRHGIITPKETIPNTEVKWPNSKMLTGLGVSEAFRGGQELRKRYITGANPLVPETWHPKDVYVRSSAMYRSNQHAITLALAMYPLGTGPSMYGANETPVPSEELSFQPVAVNTVPDGTDNLLRAWTGKTNCSLYRSHLKELVKTTIYSDKVNENREFLTRMQEVSGYRKDDSLEVFLFDINSLQEALSSELAHGFPFLGVSPSPISMDDYLKMKALGDWNYVQQFKGFGRLLGGAFVEELINNLNGAKAGGGPKLSIYSGHQRTFFGIEYAMNILQGRVPPTGYRYEFELFSVNGGSSYGLQITGIDLLGNAEVIPIPNCTGDDGLCPLDTFIELVSPMIPDNWELECGNIAPDKPSSGPCVAETVAINEVQADGPDYIELFNYGTSDINLEGWSIKDDNANTFTFGSYVLKSKAHVVLQKSSVPAALNFDFGLGKSGDSVTLSSPLGQIDSVSWGEDVYVDPGKSLSKCSLDGPMVFVTSSAGEANKCEQAKSSGEEAVTNEELKKLIEDSENSVLQSVSNAEDDIETACAAQTQGIVQRLIALAGESANTQSLVNEMKSVLEEVKGGVENIETSLAKKDADDKEWPKKCSPLCVEPHGRCEPNGRCTCRWNRTGPNGIGLRFNKYGYPNKIQADHCGIHCRYGWQQYERRSCLNQAY
eukprot:Nk52_evm11s914 gene=Nk52_evmTU11s914